MHNKLSKNKIAFHYLEFWCGKRIPNIQADVIKCKSTLQVINIS